MSFQCGRSFDPNFLFLWPNARVAIVGPSHCADYPGAEAESRDETELQRLKERLEEESSAFHSSSRVWDDGVILPQDTRTVMFLFNLLNLI
uniref:Methylcrotonoyl-CoA carboxylase beta chain, mitochondrial-like n=1 Tax=Callorhinchus milii TaxID=7868 RepID=A0A4W3GBL2_CALMI